MDSSQRLRRATNACKQCRSRKVKCSGTQPCDKCQFRRQECVYDDDRKISVSEELFLSMKRKIDRLEGSLAPEKKRCRASSECANSTNDTTKETGGIAMLIDQEPAQKISPVLSTPMAVEELPESHKCDEQFASNPLASPSRYIKHTGCRQRTWLFLGPTSTWSFSHRVLNNIRDRLNPDSSTPIPLAADGDAYQIHWRRASSDETPDTSGLPSLEYAIFLFNAVKFRLSPLYRLFDDEEFLQSLHEFYENAAAKAQESRLWYVQYLVVMAFGEALLAPIRTTSNTSAWTKYFTRAISLLPDTTKLWNEPILAIETLALVALYFHSVDMRDTAYCYIGHSIRMALVEGYYRALPVDQLGEKMVERCTNIWWTVYVLDRKFSSLIGSPSAVSDEDITATLWDPKSCSHEAAALSLHVRISQVIYRVLNTVYGADGKLGGLYIRKVRSVLREVTNLSQELEDVFAHRFRNSVDALSGVTTRLTLSCHSCIIVVIRPLILSLLWERLGSVESGDTSRTLSAPVQTLVEACIDSATKSLKILTALRDHNLLESFLPFDLESLFSASFILSLISTILPESFADHTYRDTGLSLLDDMIARGNQVARIRKSEIRLLEDLLQPLRQPVQVRKDRPREALPRQCSQGTTLQSQERDYTQPRLESVAGINMEPALGSDMGEEDLLFDWRDFGMSLNQMLSATDQLNADPSIRGAEEDGLADLWLWSDA